MKNVFSPSFARGWLAAALLFLAGCATTQRSDVPGTLAVQVNIPPTMNLMLEDRISDAFVDQVREVFHRAGFNRPVEEIRFVKAGENAPNLLTINLHDWRIDRIGNIDCTFTADLQTPEGAKHLGVYNDTSLGITRGFGWFGLARAFEEAAEGAIRELCNDVARTDLLAGLRAGVA